MVIVFNKLFIVSLATKKVAISGLSIFEKKIICSDCFNQALCFYILGSTGQFQLDISYNHRLLRTILSFNFSR